MSQSAIRCEALVRQFAGVEAVNGVDLDVQAGEIYGFLGPNGAGQVHDRAHALHAARTDERHTRRSRASTSWNEPGAVRLRIGVALQDAALDPRQTGTESCCCCKAGSTACRARTRAGASRSSVS